VDVFEGVARRIVCRENPAWRCAERYCEEIERKRKTDGEERRKRRECERRRERGRERPRTEKGESSRIDLVVGSAGGGAGTQVLLLVYRLSV